MDIILGFNTTYFNQAIGEEIWQPKKLAYNYMTGDFLIDFLSTMPF
jgi:hypothetical protein